MQDAAATIEVNWFCEFGDVILEDCKGKSYGKKAMLLLEEKVESFSEETNIVMEKAL